MSDPDKMKCEDYELEVQFSSIVLTIVFTVIVWISIVYTCEYCFRTNDSHQPNPAEKRFVVDPTSDLSQKHSFAIVMATLIHNGFNLYEPTTMIQEQDGIGNIVFTQPIPDKGNNSK